MNHIKKALVALTSIALLSGLAACGDAEPSAAPTTVATVTASAEPAVTVTTEAPMEAPAEHDESASEIVSVEEDGSYYDDMGNHFDKEGNFIPEDDIQYIEVTDEDVYQIRHFEEDIIAHLELDGEGFLPNTSCEAVVIMPNATTVDLYADAGDLVATNPNGTAGVKVGSDGNERNCLAFFEEALSDFGVEG